MSHRQPRTVLAHLMDERGWSVRHFCRLFAETAATMNVDVRAISERTVKHWRSGQVRRPHEATCRVLEQLFGLPVDQLFAPPRAPGTPAAAQAAPWTPPRTLGSVATRDVRYEEGTTDRREFVALSASVAASVSGDAEDALRFLIRADEASPAEIVDLLWSDVRRLARTYGDQLTFLVDDLVVARRAAFRLLDGPNPPGLSRDLHFLAGIVCAMLAHTARDLGQPRSAIAYQHSALLCAERSGHAGLRIFARTEQAATAYWTGDHVESAHLAHLAADEARSMRGSLSVLPAVQEARAWAAAGRTDLAQAAITRASALRDQVTPDDLDAIGGILALPLPEQLGIVAGTAAWLPDAAEAERAAREALDAFQSAPPHERSYNSEVIARADLALARVRQGLIDGAAEAISPILVVPSERRVHQIQASVGRVAEALGDRRFRNSTAAGDTIAAIESFIHVGHVHPSAGLTAGTPTD
jgi:hypothetical protein